MLGCKVSPSLLRIDYQTSAFDYVCGGQVVRTAVYRISVKIQKGHFTDQFEELEEHYSSVFQIARMCSPLQVSGSIQVVKNAFSKSREGPIAQL